MFVNVKEAVKIKLKTITTIQEVHNFPTLTFNGYPSAVVKVLRNDSQFQTTIENKRDFVVMISIVQDIQQGASETNTQKAYNIIEEVIDDVEEAFAKDPQLNGIITLPDNETMITCFPMLGLIDNNDTMVVAEIEMHVILQFNIKV